MKGGFVLEPTFFCLSYLQASDLDICLKKDNFKHLKLDCI